jgi:lipid-A-disaccharide synthase
MQAEGFNAVMPFEPFNKMGFVEVFRNISFFLDARKRLRQQMEKQKPDCLVCVDYPGFNMLMMKDAYKLGIPVVWYIAPMVWAWKQNRAEVLAKHCTHIACIFPFEVQYFSSFTSRVSFVGNPLIEAIQRESRDKVQESNELHLAIVPGSRWQEVKRALPCMIQTFLLLKERFPGIKGSISHCANLPLSFYEDLSKGTDLSIAEESLRTLLSRSDFAVVTSGTATLEAALLGVPQICGIRHPGSTIPSLKYS